MTEQTTLLILGAAGDTGAAVVRHALERGYRVRVADRKETGFASDERVEEVIVDVLEDEGLDAAMDGITTVVSGLGLPIEDPKTAVDPPPLYSAGTRNIVEAMRRTGADRLVVVSATFVETTERGPLWFRTAARSALTKVFDDMRAMEATLADARDIRWTAVRPGWLYPEASYAGDSTVTANVIPQDMIRTRVEDLAAFMLDCALSDEWVHATPAIARPEDPSVSQPIAVLESHLD